jgi:hypothetical protein
MHGHMNIKIVHLVQRTFQPDVVDAAHDVTVCLGKQTGW